jgi:hypothetical protein
MTNLVFKVTKLLRNNFILVIKNFNAAKLKK